MQSIDRWYVEQAANALDNGGVIAYPTESIFGLGCNPSDENAVINLLTIKQRSWRKGLILIAADFNQLQKFIQPLSSRILEQLRMTWPGPVTWLLRAKPDISNYLRGEHQTIAVRVTAHKQSANLCRSFGGAIVSTSANLSNMPPAKTIHDVHWSLPNLDYVLPGLCSGATTPSEIRDAQTGSRIR